MEQQGCRVLASDCNDFPKPLDQHSYEACLKTIEEADIFALFIGSRVGGWWDEKKRISITQQEYRTAYALQLKGNLRLLSFVRSDVWDFRENVKALERKLKTMDDLDKDVREEIKSYPNRFATDAQFVADFIDEVSRNKETRDAVSHGGAFPIGNWLHEFSTFGEVVQAIEPLLFQGVSADIAVGRKALQNQLLALLQATILKIGNRTLNVRPTVQRLAATYPINADAIGIQIRISKKDWSFFLTFLFRINSIRISPDSLLGYLNGSLLLDYDPRAAAYHETPSYLALVQLIDEIRLLNHANGETLSSSILEEIKQDNPLASHVILPAHRLALHMHRFYRWVNIVELSAALVRAMGGQELRLPALLPRSPFQDMNDELKAEDVTLEEARAFAEGIPQTIGPELAP